ncbi:DUF3025 domain-containing protein [Pinirhizobacter sp.]|jgi:hypothetical protein|uniref:DUF3025 domain-containing protein n=1 Tax=Pinirhizobacter sp. TaxID=2950432 RepID=UPI002F41505E
MRYVAPTREALDARVLGRHPLDTWSEAYSFLGGALWPSIEVLNAHRPASMVQCFVAQTPQLLADGLHYEERIAVTGAIATRQCNWHDLFNALVWMRYPAIKQALNLRQVGEIAVMGRRERSRSQCALTHFDEAGIVVTLRDPAMVEAWNAHDWETLFRGYRQAWLNGDTTVHVFGHALLEHALTPAKLLVGKAMVFLGGSSGTLDACAAAIGRGEVLNDPQELRPFPLSGLPGWHEEGDAADFYRATACFQPVREGRLYPPVLATA